MKKSLGERIFNVFNCIIMIIGACAALFPFVHVLSKSLSGEAAILSGKVILFPLDFTISAYKTVFSNSSMNSAFFFTVLLTVVGTAINILMTTLAAYPLSKRGLIGKNVVWLMILFTMFFNGGIIPTYLLVSNLNLLNSIWALILPVAISTYNMIIMKTFFQAIPESLEESAKLDGCTEIGILFKIVIPLSLPVIATLSLFYAVNHWNSFQNALIYINDTTKYTLQLKLRQLVLQDQIAMMVEGGAVNNIPRESLKAAAIMYATIPILVVYPWLQKYFVKGVLIGAVKA